MATLARGLAGAAGEYLVASQLSLRGWLATVTIKNAPGTDVLAQNQESGALVAIQTKTKTASKGFRLTVKDEREARPNEWFVLVDLKGEGGMDTDFYVVPRAVVAALAQATHQHWLATPGAGGRKHNDNPLREILPELVEGYRGEWELLHVPPAAAPLALGKWAREAIEKHGRVFDKILL